MSIRLITYFEKKKHRTLFQVLLHCCDFCLLISAFLSFKFVPYIWSNYVQVKQLWHEWVHCNYCGWWTFNVVNYMFNFFVTHEFIYLSIEVKAMGIFHVFCCDAFINELSFGNEHWQWNLLSKCPRACVSSNILHKCLLVVNYLLLWKNLVVLIIKLLHYT